MIKLDSYGEPDRGPWRHPYIVVQPGLRRLLHDLQPEQTLPWSKLAAGTDLAQVEHLDIWSDRESVAEALPPWLPQLTHLKWLGLPSQICDRLRPDMLPPGVTWLKARIEYDQRPAARRRAVFAEAARFAEVEQLGTSQDCYLCTVNYAFGVETFPNLEHLGLKLDAKGRMLPVIAAQKRLQVLRLRGFGQLAETAQRLAPLGLAALSLGGTHRHADLTGIGALASLRHLKLVGFSAVTDLAPLRELPLLESIGLYWMPRLADIGPLLGMPSLKKIGSFGCKAKKHWRQDLDRATERGIDLSHAL